LAVEGLTVELETRARALVAEVEDAGGIVRASETGWLHGRLTASAEAYRAGVKDGRLPVVGVNCFAEGDEGVSQVFAQPAAAPRQADRLRRLRAARDAAACGQALGELARALEGAGNAFPAVTAAVEAGATLGEVHARFRSRYGPWALPLA
jgi:methylmalonyl-CoA mutase N-terminal domain/subunit